MAALQLNSTAASLLGFLHDGPLTGAALYRTAEARIGDFWSLTRSQVYRELDGMTRAGLVSAGARGSRDARTFTITRAGRAAFRAWAAQEPELESIRFPLLLLVGFGEHVPAARLRAHLAAHRRIHATRLERYRQIQQSAGEADPAAGGSPGTAVPIGVDDSVGGGAAAPDVAPSRDREPFALATLAFGLAYEAAVMDWFEEVERILPPA